MRSKTVLLHDWLTGFRGGERVLEALCELYPDAPIYTLLHAPGSTSQSLESKVIHTSFLQALPGITENYRKLLPVMPLAAERLKICDEDVSLVLSSSHCVIKGVRKPPGAVHLSYIHSPMRYMYDQYDTYFGPQAGLAMRLGGRVFRNYLVNWDRRSNEGVDVMVANSAFVRERIRRYYDRDAEIVHPFVELDDFKSQLGDRSTSKGEDFVMVTAFAPNKRVDMAIEAFNRLRLPLAIIGSGQQERELRSLAGPTVRFLGNVDRREVIETLARGRALIFPGVEDFGITPLEALAAGTPVIAYRAGGVLETLREDEDTVFFDQATAESLMDAVTRFQSTNLKPRRERLEAFSRPRFLREMSQLIDAALKR